MALGIFLIFSNFCFQILLAGHYGWGAMAQQLYSQDWSEDCDNYHAESSGYLCNGAAKECRTFALYRAQENYMSLGVIAELFNMDTATIAAASNLSVLNSSKSLAKDQALLFPIDCKCAGNFSQANVTYTVKHDDTYLKIANQTLEGLTTCQAMREQNPTHDANSLETGMKLVAPLRCACPTATQVAAGVKYLLSYIADPDDNDDLISVKFQIRHEDFISANELEESNPTIYPYTTLLIPLTHTPTIPPSGPFAPPPPPVFRPSPPQVFTPVHSSSSNSKGIRKALAAGLSASVVFASIIVIAALLFIKKRKKRTDHKFTEEAKAQKLEYEERTKESSSLLSQMSDLLNSDRLIRYTFEELQSATDNFGEAHRIKGSVFRGILRGKRVAIKQMKGQVSQEMNMLHKFHHANLVSLLGICFSEANKHSYLVFEYAENGSLGDWLHGPRSREVPNKALGWNQRLRIALDIAEGLEYLHHGTRPSCVHKDIKSSNILLDKNFRAKIANFGLAKSGAGPTAITSHIVGTHGYMAPEFLRDGLVTPKLDVFSFGVILLEILSGKTAICSSTSGGERLLSEEIRVLMESENPMEKLSDWIDPQIEVGSYDLEAAFGLASVAKLCVEKDLTLRPSVRDIRVELSRLAGFSTANSSHGSGGGNLSISSEFQAR